MAVPAVARSESCPTSSAARPSMRIEDRSRKSLMQMALAVVTLLAFLLRMVRLGYFNLSGDEAVTATFSTQPVSTIIQALRHLEPHPPLLYLLVHVWIPLAGDSEVALRFTAVVAGTALVPMTYIVGARLFSSGTGLVAAATVAVNPYQLWNSQDGRMYAIATLLGLAALYAAARLLAVGHVDQLVSTQGVEDKADIPARPWRRSGQGRWLLGYIVAMSLALFTHYYSIYTMALL